MVTVTLRYSIKQGTNSNEQYIYILPPNIGRKAYLIPINDIYVSFYCSELVVAAACELVLKDKYQNSDSTEPIGLSLGQ